MLQGLTGSYAVIRIINKEFHDEILDIGTGMRDQLDDARSFNSWEVELHVRCIFLEVIKQGFFGTAQYVVNFVHLVNFIVAREQWKERYDFEEDASDAPEVHFVAIVPISEQTLGRPVPSG